MDPLPGWKTKITAVLTAAFNVLSVLGVLEIPPETVAEINAGALALIGLFLAMKTDRHAKGGGLR
jgi:hypothetical protein